MSVPILVLMFVAVATAVASALTDHAAHAAATDLAELHADQAAAALTQSCLSDTGCALPPDADACISSHGVIVTTTVAFDARLWTNLNAVTARRVVAYDSGTDTDTALAARLAGIADAC